MTHANRKKRMDRINMNRILLAGGARAMRKRLEQAKATRGRREKELKEAIRAERKKGTAREDSSSGN